MTAVAVSSVPPAAMAGLGLGGTGGRPALTLSWAELADYARAAARSGGCTRPVRVRGRVDAIDLATGERRTMYDTHRFMTLPKRMSKPWAAGESACRPGSVHPLARAGGHPSRAAVAGSLVRSTREHRAGHPQALALTAAFRPRFLLTLLRVGFTEPPQSPAALVVSYTTVSPLPRDIAPGRSVFCGTFPRVTPGRRYRPPCPAEPGPSSPGRSVPARPPGRLARRQAMIRPAATAHRPLRCAVSFRERSRAAPSGYQSISHSDATSSCIRNSDAGDGASSARATSCLIGVT
jgi:hypothetical protein